jgi:hypothetical protein
MTLLAEVTVRSHLPIPFAIRFGVLDMIGYGFAATHEGG